MMSVVLELMAFFPQFRGDDYQRVTKSISRNMKSGEGPGAYPRVFAKLGRR